MVVTAGANSFGPYEVDDECLNRIDALERINDSDAYRRDVIDVVSTECRKPDIKEALGYLMPPEYVTDRRSNFLTTYRLDDAEKCKPKK